MYLLESPAKYSGLFVCLTIMSTFEVVRSAKTNTYCGQDLTNMLRLLCAGRYHSNSGAERSHKETQQQMTITQECCIQGCTRDTLFSYCASPEEAKHKNAIPTAVAHFSQGTTPKSQLKLPELLSTTTRAPRLSNNRGPSRYETVLRKHAVDLSPLYESSYYD